MGPASCHVDKNGKPLTSLYNYLKPYTPFLTERFYSTYGNPESFSLQTASPVLGSLNSGLQLYRMKYEKPEVFKNLFYSITSSAVPEFSDHR